MVAAKRGRTQLRLCDFCFVEYQASIVELERGVGRFCCRKCYRGAKKQIGARSNAATHRQFEIENDFFAKEG